MSKELKEKFAHLKAIPEGKSYPPDFNEKLQWIAHEKSEAGEEEFLDFLAEIEEDTEKMEIEELREKYFLTDSWEKEDLINLKVALEQYLTEEKEIKLIYPKRYERIFEDLKKEIYNFYILKQTEKINELLGDILLTAMNKLKSLPAPQSMRKYNFRQWQYHDFQLLHKELSGLTRGGISETELGKYRIAGFQKEVKQAMLKSSITDISDEDIIVNGIDGKTLETEILGGKQAQSTEYDARNAVDELITGDRLINEDLKAQIIETYGIEKYRKFLQELKNVIIPLSNLAKGFANVRTGEKTKVVMSQISAKKQRFLATSGINKGLALKAFVDSLYRFAIIVQNAEINPTDPVAPNESNIFTKHLNFMHSRLAEKLMARGIIAEKGDLKLVSAIGTPLDLGASCDFIFVLKTKKGKEYVIPVDITGNKEKITQRGQKYGELYLYYRYFLPADNELDLENGEEVEKFIFKTGIRLRQAINNFIGNAVNMLEKQEKSDFNESKGINALFQRREALERKSA